MTVQPDLCQTCSETTLLVFPRSGSLTDVFHQVLNNFKFSGRVHSVLSQVRLLACILFLPILCHGSDEKFQRKILAELSRLEDKTEELKDRMDEKDKQIAMLEKKLEAKDQEISALRNQKR